MLKFFVEAAVIVTLTFPFLPVKITLPFESTFAIFVLDDLYVSFPSPLVRLALRATFLTVDLTVLFEAEMLCAAFEILNVFVIFPL